MPTAVQQASRSRLGPSVLVFLRDLHGPPIFAGAATGAALLAARLDVAGRQ